MREELQKCLADQFSHLEAFNVGQHVFDNFDYKINKDQLKVENIFVKNFNLDVYFRPKNPLSFVANLMEKLETDGQQLKDKAEDVFEMLKAIKNLIQYQNILSTPNFEVNRVVTLICNLLTSISQLQTLSHVESIATEILLQIAQSASDY